MRIALSTTPMDDSDRAIMRTALPAMYEAADLKPPHVVAFVASPFVASVAGGIAAHLLANKVRTVSPNLSACVSRAVDVAVLAASWAQPQDADEAAANIRRAICEVTPNLKWREAKDVDADKGRTKALLESVSNVFSMWADGGEWTGYCEWLEFFRTECGFEARGVVDYSKWRHWCDATLHGGVRIMHEQFCIVSDRPREMHIETVNGSGRLHALNTPAKSYGDGWSIYSIHGVRVPRHVVMEPQRITADEIRSTSNMEVRRVMIDRFGAGRYLHEIGAEVVHTDTDALGFPRVLMRADISDDEPLCIVEVVNSTPEPIDYVPEPGAAGVWSGNRWHKKYTLRVPPDTTTAQAAVAWTFDLPADRYAPAVES
jgi:hypothetical protein